MDRRGFLKTLGGAAAGYALGSRGNNKDLLTSPEAQEGVIHQLKEALKDPELVELERVLKGLSNDELVLLTNRASRAGNLWTPEHNRKDFESGQSSTEQKDENPELKPRLTIVIQDMLKNHELSAKILGSLSNEELLSLINCAYNIQ